MSPSDAPIVLVVDDEPDVADAYAAQLGERYTVRTAYSGQDALEMIDGDVSVVLLDRRMPGLSGDGVLERIRGDGIDARIAMVTAVDPDFDIIEMPFDDYLTKPVSREDLFTTVERLLTCAKYESQFQQFYALTNKIATLRANKSEADLENSEEFERLQQERQRTREQLDDTIAEFDDDDFAVMFREMHPSAPSVGDGEE
ncbi:response regulator [Halapricum sp. CBA1109]|uniref:response regulator transcription factor n=1 Tax=Halapricum sp. CBA1109 TaxID=2668068 RepID=UPI0012FAE04E|nr:HalX domain-containing protein [Halapricum sp. CBA1109]MUV89579.1 response regulator [Halapricum sp. CBA1109]